MILKNALLIDKDFKQKRLDIKFEDGIISQIAENIEGEGIDLSDKFILPGFIDTHIHGAAGTRICTPEFDPEKITVYEASQGVTAIAITSSSTKTDAVYENYEMLARCHKNLKGAKIAAIHAEGPFLNPKYKGAMNPENIIAPDTEILDKMVEKSGGLLKLITIAPEREGAPDFIKYAVSKGLTVSMGHTDAKYAEAEAGAKMGATQVTHTFNAMRPLNHREPGILGYALTDDSITCEMICDHVHLHPAALMLIYKIKGADRINIISDSGHAAGANITQFEVDGIMRYIKDGVIRLEDGTIAGSAMSMHAGIKNLLNAGISLGDVSKMASFNPARTLKLEDKTGSLEVGKCADIVVLDKNYDVCMTFVDGKCEYKRD